MVLSVFLMGVGGGPCSLLSVVLPFQIPRLMLGGASSQFSPDALIFGIYGDRDNKCISVVCHEIGFTIELQLKTPSLKKHNGYCYEKLFMPSLCGTPAH